jgi:hypothetical protein
VGEGLGVRATSHQPETQHIGRRVDAAIVAVQGADFGVGGQVEGEFVGAGKRFGIRERVHRRLNRAVQTLLPLRFGVP